MLGGALRRVTAVIAYLRSAWPEPAVLQTFLACVEGVLPGHGEDDSPRMVVCAVVRCPVCERQRPYPISRDKYEAGRETYRLEQGVGLHLVATHSIRNAERDALTDQAVSDAEVRKVPEDLLENVDTGNRKWDDYGL